MALQRIRLFLLVSLFITGIILYGEWQKEHAVLTETSTASQMEQPDSQSLSDIPEAKIPVLTQATAVPSPNSHESNKTQQLIEVNTDVLSVKIDLLGGDIVWAQLPKYPQSIDTPDQGEILLSSTPSKLFVAQTGLIGKDNSGPDSRQSGRAQYAVKQTQFSLGQQERLDVELYWQNEAGLKVTKTFRFKANDYLVDVVYRIENQSSETWVGNVYGQLRREQVKKSNGMLGVQTTDGAALYTPEKPFKKLSYSDMKKHTFKEQIEGGWVAMLDHYFLCAYIPKKESNHYYYTRYDDGIYNIGATTAVQVAPGEQVENISQLYIGPEIADTLKEISPGLNLTVDYGILWPISLVLFWLLKHIHHFVGNWGWSIIIVTILIKLVFYKLSATSYRSMGKMRKLQPKMEALKQRYADNKQQFSVALMELYRKEKINPLGGCLPILIQIPVFIALYYVLLESIELRQAPFMLWIQDLSSRDPYYVLPIIMGATMFFQQRLNPAPPDPMQAKVMMLMPFVFTVLFLSFPSGLVLYWTANNLLSILQQWFIMRSLDSGKNTKKLT